jgi:hypothetical protein
MTDTPVSTPPVSAEFPRYVIKLATGQWKEIDNWIDLEAALKSGWTPMAAPEKGAVPPTLFVARAPFPRIVERGAQWKVIRDKVSLGLALVDDWDLVPMPEPPPPTPEELAAAKAANDAALAAQTPPPATPTPAPAPVTAATPAKK